MIKQAIGLGIGIAALSYVGYVMLPSAPCDRIEHSAIPATIIAKSANFLVDPWTDDRETELRVELWGLKFRLAWVQFVQKQFYYKDRVTCAWSDAEVRVKLPGLEDLPTPGGDLEPVNLPAPVKGV